MGTPDVPLTDAEIAELRRLEAATRADKGAAIDHMATAWNALPRLLNEVERSRALLKRIEWSARVNDFTDVPIAEEQACPECLAFKRDGVHNPDCELAALISPR